MNTYQYVIMSYTLKLTVYCGIVCVQYNGGLLPDIILLIQCYGNTFKCHEDVFSLQTMIPPKRFDIFPLSRYSEGIYAFRIL